MNLTYAILSIGDLLNIDFSQIEESNENTVRISLDGLEFVIKYTTIPTFIEDGSVLPLQILTTKIVWHLCRRQNGLTQHHQSNGY